MVRPPSYCPPGAACMHPRTHRAIVLQSTRKVHRRVRVDRNPPVSTEKRQNGQVSALRPVQPARPVGPARSRPSWRSWPSRHSWPSRPAAGSRGSTGSRGPAGSRPSAASARTPDPKRLLDLTLGTLLLALAAPLLTAAACALALRRPPGGIVARELRTGLHGYPFTVRSLRTRRWRLDLLSRLPHVVSGTMSLIGPAALAPEDPRAAAPWRQSVRPGLTGPAQLRRRSTLPWDEPELLDQHYVEHHWIGLDLAVLARTLPALLPPRTQGHLSDADHRPPGYSATE